MNLCAVFVRAFELVLFIILEGAVDCRCDTSTVGETTLGIIGDTSERTQVTNWFERHVCVTSGKFCVLIKLLAVATDVAKRPDLT